MTFSVRERMLKDIAADLSIVAVVSEADALLLVSRLAYLLDGGMPAADILEKLGSGALGGLSGKIAWAKAERR